jgi:hypothetical protein
MSAVTGIYLSPDIRHRLLDHRSFILVLRIIILISYPRHLRCLAYSSPISLNSFSVIAQSFRETHARTSAMSSILKFHPKSTPLRHPFLLVHSLSLLHRAHRVMHTLRTTISAKSFTHRMDRLPRTKTSMIWWKVPRNARWSLLTISKFGVDFICCQTSL